MPVANLRHEHEGEDAAEGPPVIEIARRREHDELIVHHAHDREPLIEPLTKSASRSIGRGMCHRSFNVGLCR